MGKHLENSFSCHSAQSHLSLVLPFLYLLVVLPLEPELNVMFHAVGGVVYENRILQANCTAFVGTFGHMTWVLKMRPILTWVINSDGGIIEMPIFDTDEVPWGFDVYSFYGNARSLRYKSGSPFYDRQ